LWLCITTMSKEGSTSSYSGMTWDRIQLMLGSEAPDQGLIRVINLSIAQLRSLNNLPY
jgi:hypothetical protein